MTLEEERRHLAEGAGDEIPPPALDARTVECPGGAVRALGRVRDVLGLVLTHQQGAWPGVDEWKARLPTWFVEACVDDREVQVCVLDRWSLRAWLHWMQPDQRQWRWWDASAADGTHLRVRVLPLAEPYLRGSLDWLLTVAGLPA
ncbi:MAG: hypothetical protein ACREQM_05390 [Candidatus Dormibacteraceae bacterium]